MTAIHLSTYLPLYLTCRGIFRHHSTILFISKLNNLESIFVLPDMLYIVSHITRSVCPADRRDVRSAREDPIDQRLKKSRG